MTTSTPGEHLRSRADVMPPDYRECFGCGEDNGAGLGIVDVRRDGAVVRATFRPTPQHQGFRGTVHGGIVGAALDEIMSYACVLIGGHWSATIRTELRFRRPVSVGTTHGLEGRLERHRPGATRFRCAGRLTLPDGTIAAEAHALFVAAADDLLGGVRPIH